MNRLEHLLVIFMEECSEIQHATSKALRFGLKDGKSVFPTNEEQMNVEFNQLMAVVEMLQKEGVRLVRESDIVEVKKEVVEEYLIYSKECGTLQDN